MIDIHSHIIPTLDDGPDDMEASIGMGRAADREGIATFISTSHSEEGMAMGYAAMQERLEAVRLAWAGAGVNVRLELGLEIFLRPDTPLNLQEGRAWSLAGSQYVLVEVAPGLWPPYADQVLFELQVGGFVPILAHPERYLAIQRDPNRMYTLAERGVLGQVTADALLGAQGSQAKRCAETLLRHGLAQFLSSDTHGISPRKRPPLLRDAVSAAEKLVGAQAALALVTDNPAHILERSYFTATPERVRNRIWPLGGLFKQGR